jgi:hypothetical protein
VYPTKQQTGVELFELVHMASAAFSRVAVYFENSISPADMKLLPAAAVAPRSEQRTAKGVALDCPPGLGLRWRGPVLVDGSPWPFHNADTVWLPVGKHTVQPGTSEVPLRILGFNGTLIQGRWTGFTVEFEYEGESRAAALLNEPPAGAWVDGKVPVILEATGHTTLLLPRGRHKVVIQAPGPKQREGVLQSSAVVP